MALTIKAEPIDRDIAVLLAGTPAQQSEALAEFASEQINQAKDVNRQILGRVPRYTVTVDGKPGAALTAVRPNGVIVAEFELVNDVLSWIADQLVKNSPVGTRRDPHPGLYKKSHTLFADGVEVVSGAAIPVAQEYVFINNVPYARKIELGASSQAPDGVYQAVATLARRRFGNIAKISFSYRTAIGGTFVGGRVGNRSETRTPAIIVSLRGNG